MRLSDEELRKHNEFCFQIAKHKLENSELGQHLGIMVDMPTHLNNGVYRGQIALPCGVIRDKKRKINVMQARTGSCVVSLAKEKTTYDDLLSPSLKDNTPYSDFLDPNDGMDAGVLIKKDEETPQAENISDSVYTKGILDLC